MHANLECECPVITQELCLGHVEMDSGGCLNLSIHLCFMFCKKYVERKRWSWLTHWRLEGGVRAKMGLVSST